MRGWVVITTVAVVIGCAGQASPTPTITTTITPTITPTATATATATPNPPTETPTLTVTAALTLTPGTATPQGTVYPPPATLGVEVLSVRPHDATAFTQGLVWHAGRLFESTGQRGASTLREVDPASGEALRSVALPPEYFGEGLALVGERLIQITWQEGVARVYDRESFDLLEEWQYTGEGWGLCFDGEALIMSDGSHLLTRRDPATFEALGQVGVIQESQPVVRLNELECVGELVYANVWQTDLIVQIEAATGRVLAVIDAAGLLAQYGEVPGGNGGVLNGIAYVPESDTFLITGKYWPLLFEVRFVEESGQ